MLKRVLLVTPGRYYEPEGELFLDGIEDVRWLGEQINRRGLKPQIVFFTNERYSMYSALILTGVVKSVNNIGLPLESHAHEKIRSPGRVAFWKNFREMLRAESNARAYFRKSFLISDRVEEVIVISEPGFGGVFPNTDEKKVFSHTYWVHPIVWTLDIQTQILSLSCNPGERFGSI